MALNVDLAGKTYPPLTYEVTSASVNQYAKATNEVNAIYFAGDAVAPPAFPIVPAGPAIRAIFEDEELGVNMARLVQAEEEHIFHAPIRVGNRLTVRSILKDVTAGEAGDGFSIATTLSTEGAPAVEIISSMAIRGSGIRRPPSTEGSRAARPESPEILFETSEQVDMDQTYRYAEASGDHNLIHVDPDFARGSAGLPGIIVHGMCTMAFASRAVMNALANGDPLRLARIKVEFSRPVFPGQTLTTRGWLNEDAGKAMSYGFETVNPRGQQVIKQGVAVIRA